MHDKKINGHLSGHEEGICVVDLSTGMPSNMDDSVHVGGLVQIEGHATDIVMVKTIKMIGGKVK